MSRTNKDKPDKFLHEAYDKDYIQIPGTWYHIWAKTSRTKKRKTLDTEWHWMGTPSWWNNLHTGNKTYKSLLVAG